MKRVLGISVIITTYNWPQALDRVLAGLNQQSYVVFEVIIADDGSTPETAALIKRWQAKATFRLHHCWQPDEGFRAAKCRNQAAAMARYEYLIFMDGDCIPLPHFIQRHAQLAEPGWFVAGNRILLTLTFTQQVIAGQLAIEQWSLGKWMRAALKGQCNKIGAFFHLPLGPLRKLGAKKWQGAKTCNLAIWREDFLRVNGMDENFKGWGYEDSDLVIRLQRAKIYHKSGKWAVPVLHLWHPEQDRAQIEKNANLLQNTLQQTYIKAEQGVAQYLKNASYSHVDN